MDISSINILFKDVIISLMDPLIDILEVEQTIHFLETDLSKFKSDTFDRFWNRFQLSGYDVQDVRGDGGCYYRCLSLFYTGSEDSYNKYR